MVPCPMYSFMSCEGNAAGGATPTFPITMPSIPRTIRTGPMTGAPHGRGAQLGSWSLCRAVSMSCPHKVHDRTGHCRGRKPDAR